MHEAITQIPMDYSARVRAVRKRLSLSQNSIGEADRGVFLRRQSMGEWPSETHALGLAADPGFRNRRRIGGKAETACDDCWIDAG